MAKPVSVFESGAILFISAKNRQISAKALAERIPSMNG